MMMPFGNMCAYFKLPDWVTNFGSDLEEKDHDPPDVKALKVSTAKCFCDTATFLLFLIIS